MNTSDVLRKAADLIEENGHWDGTAPQPSDRFCAVTAIARTVFDIGSRRTGVTTEAIIALGQYLGIGPVLVYWNDETPGEVVVKEMRACADALDEVTA